MQRVFALVAVAAATLATALPAPPALAAAALRASVIVSNGGGAGMPPSVTLEARLPQGADGEAIPVARLLLAFDRRHLDPAALEALADEPPHTLIGNVTTDLTGAPALPLRVVSASQAPGAEPTVSAEIDLPASLAAVAGAAIPVTIAALSASQLGATIDLSSAEAALLAVSATQRIGRLDLTLGSVPGLHVTASPHAPVRLSDGVTAWPCSASSRAQGGCAPDEAAPTSATASVDLPRSPVLRIPSEATYGLPLSVGGRGHPGDAVRVCSTFDQLGDACAAIGAGAVDATGALHARVVPHTIFDPLTHRVVAPATGLYVVLDTQPEGGVVAAFASAVTVVRLAPPSLGIHRVERRRLRLTLRVPGGDRDVRVTLRSQGRTLARGAPDAYGRFTRVVSRPRGTVRFTAYASIGGAVPSRSASVRFPALPRA